MAADGGKTVEIVHMVNNTMLDLWIIVKWRQ